MNKMNQKLDSGGRNNKGSSHEAMIVGLTFIFALKYQTIKIQIN